MASWIVLLSSVLYFFSYPEVDPDLWGHLFFGRQILESGRLPAQNLYSYTAPAHPWINHEWLSEIIFAGLFALADSPGLIVLKTGVGAAIVWILNALLGGRGIPRLPRTLALVWAMAVLSPGFNIRPQIFTYLLFAAFLLLFYRDEKGSRSRLYWAPLLVLFWVNLHGGFVAGLAALGLFAAWRAARGLKSGESLSSVVAEVVLPAVLSGMALFFNPYRSDLLVFLARDIFLNRPITEWQPVALLDLSHFEFKLALLVGLLGAAAGRAWRRWDFWLAVLAAWFALRHQRHTPLFAIVIVPYLAMALEPACQWMGQRARASILGLLLLAGVSYQLHHLGKTRLEHGLELVVSPLEYPTQAADFLARNRISGNLAVPFDWGEYLIWKLYPEVRVSIDGRYTTAYPLEVILDSWEWMGGGERWRNFLERYPAEVAVTKRGHPVTALMRQDAGWVYIYSDPVAFIFVRKVPSQEELLKKFVEKRLLPPQPPPLYFPG